MESTRKLKVPLRNKVGLGANYLAAFILGCQIDDDWVWSVKNPLLVIMVVVLISSGIFSGNLALDRRHAREQQEALDAEARAKSSIPDPEAAGAGPVAAHPVNA